MVQQITVKYQTLIESLYNVKSSLTSYYGILVEQFAYVGGTFCSI